MNERTIFIEALEIESPERRTDFLDSACGGDPALRDRIERLLESHEQAGSFLGKMGPERLAEELAAGQIGELTLGTPGHEHVGEELGFLTPSSKPESLGGLGHYDIREVIGRGGMGIVLRAFDERLHRVVAVKVMAAQLATSVTARKRFRREAQAAAAVSHDHIVTIHAVEEANGLPYIAMQYVVGLSLEERIQRDGPLALHEILRIGMQTASGLAAAHAQGLIHRDIKPANILLENGVERVKITDFGLARAAADASLTQTGAVAGTPHFMAPEQARGDALDARSDLFSLGSVLYAMCTGHSPFRAGSSLAVLRRVCEDTPTPIRQINPEIPECLAEIVEKLHAKDPADRFQSATEVAELLGRHLAHVQHPSVVGPVSNSPVNPKAGSNSTLRLRRRAIAAAVLLLFLLGAASLTEATGVTQLRATAIRIFTPDGTLVVEVDDPGVKVSIEGDGGLVITGAGPQEVRVRPGSYQVHATKDGMPVHLDRDLVTITRGEKQVVKISLLFPGRRAPATTAPGSPAPRQVHCLKGHTGEIRSMDLSPDGRRILSGGDDQTIRLWDADSGREIRQFTEGHQIAHTIVFSADGQRALSSGWVSDGTARLWDVESGTEERRFRHGSSNLLGAALSIDGRHALTSGHDNTLRLWDVETGNELRRFDYHEPVAIRSIAFSPDGQYAATGALDATPSSAVRLWAVETGKEVRRFRGHTNWVASVAFSSDGQRVLSGSWDKTLRLWDVASGNELLRLDHADKVDTAAISLNGRLALSGCFDGSVHLWDLETGKQLLRFQAHDGAVKALALHPNGRDFVSAGADGSIRLWMLPDNAIPKASTLIPGAFVLLGGEVDTEQRFDTLAEVVQRASDGDTIEVRGNGPFVTEPIHVLKKSLSLRAGRGYWPVIRLGYPYRKQPHSLLLSDSPLTLEGLELQRLNSIDDGVGVGAVVDARGPLRMANVRLVHTGAATALGLSRDWASAEIVNSQMISHWSGVGLWQDGSLEVRNSVFSRASPLGMGLSVNMRDRPTNMAIKLVNNTFVVGEAIRFGFWGADEWVNDGKDQGPFSLEASGNVLACPCVVSMIWRDETGIDTSDEARAGMRRMGAWKETSNLYGVQFFLGLRVNNELVSLLAGYEDWREFWNVSTPPSLQGEPVFQGVDHQGPKHEKKWHEVLPTDFRLAAGSPGQGQGEGGKDLGADGELVGPGAAYERWKKTLEYQKWLEETKRWTVTGSANSERDAANTELAKWQGEWENSDYGRLVIRGDRWASFSKDGFEVVSTIKIVEVTDEMTHILLLNAGVDGKVRTIQTILRVDGDTLHNCGTIGSVRPTEFATKPGFIYTRWKRVTKPTPDTSQAATEAPANARETDRADAVRERQSADVILRHGGNVILYDVKGDSFRLDKPGQPWPTGAWYVRMVEANGSTTITNGDLPALRDFPQLGQVGFANTQVTTAAVLDHIEGKPVAQLSLNNVPTTSADAARLAKIKTLERIYITGADWGDDDIALLAGLPLLRRLNIGSTKITDRSMEDLGRLPRLTDLYLAGAKVTDTGLAALHPCKSLRILNVSKTLVTADGVEKLRQALPECQVTADEIGK